MTYQSQSGQKAALLSGRALVLAGCGFVAASLFSSNSFAHNNKVSIKVKGGERCIVSNGLPNHNTGTFPNSGNPNRISKQNVNLCVTTSPRKGGRAKQIRGSIGVGINGVQFRPGTADYYDASSRRGFSRNGDKSWRLDGLGASQMLGIDSNNAHVDNRGLYHYHGIANALVKSGKGSLIGWAADGFEIHYVGSHAKSSYRLKSGNRSSGPGGRHDGTYVQDWKYVAGSGTLDQCNGGTLNGKFVYFTTESYPFLPHCLWGKVSNDFAQRGGGGGLFGIFKKGPKRNAGQGRKQRVARADGQRGNGFGRRRPPRVALQACQSKQTGSSCAFNGRGNRRISGTCRPVQGGSSACVPRRR